MSKETESVQEQAQEQTVVPSDNQQQEVLDDIFNMKNDNPFMKESNSEENVVEDNSLSPLDIDNQQDDQYRYWQSQHDKKQAELDEIKSKYADMEEIIPIARHIKRNPDLLNTMNEKETKQEEALPELVKPERPVKPRDFSRSEAMADPDSSSAKYLDAQDDYVSSMSEYMLDKENRRDQQAQKVAAEQAVFTQRQETLVELTGKHGYSPDMANDFVKTMSDPQSLSLDNLVKLHKLNIGMSTTEGNQQVSPQAQQKQQTMQSRTPKLTIPKPIGVQPGQNVQSSNKSTEDNMMDNMINNHKKDNPFQ